MAGVSSLLDPYKVHDYALDQGSKNLEFIVNDLMDPEKGRTVAQLRYPTAKGLPSVPPRAIICPIWRGMAPPPCSRRRRRGTSTSGAWTA